MNSLECYLYEKSSLGIKCYYQSLEVLETLRLTLCLKVATNFKESIFYYTLCLSI